MELLIDLDEKRTNKPSYSEGGRSYDSERMQAAEEERKKAHKE
jgi:hypothetical protein